MIGYLYGQKYLCVIIFLSVSGCGANVPKVKYRQNVQGIKDLLMDDMLKLIIPISWEKQFLHWPQYCK